MDFHLSNGCNHVRHRCDGILRHATYFDFMSPSGAAVSGIPVYICDKCGTYGYSDITHHVLTCSGRLRVNRKARTCTYEEYAREVLLEANK